MRNKFRIDSHRSIKGEDSNDPERKDRIEKLHRKAMKEMNKVCTCKICTVKTKIQKT